MLRSVIGFSVVLCVACSSGSVDSSGGAGDAGADEPGDAPGDSPADPDAPAPDPDPDPDPEPPPTRFGLSARPANPDCVALPRPSDAGVLSLESDPFPGVEGTAGAFYTDLRRGAVDLEGRMQWFAIGQFGTFETWPDDREGAPFTVLTADALQGFRSGGELGLLGLALDPRYPSVDAPNTVRTYVNYTGDCGSDICSYLSRFDLAIADDGDVMSVSDEEVLFRVLQPENNHNAGALLFGNDGLLYMTLGDGGGGNDPWCSGLNLGTPLGKLLRFDVHSVANGYAIPADNPFRGDEDGAYARCSDHQVDPESGSPDLSRDDPCPEIYAYGLRNPFRMTVDRQTGWLWLGDVGQGQVEEMTGIDPAVVAPNYNLGWPLREGDIAKPGAVPEACEALVDARGALNTDFTEPRFVHKHSGPTGNAGRQSVVAGFVYRGEALGTAYYGSLLFGDYGTGELWFGEDPYRPGTQDVDGLALSLNTRQIGFAEDEDQELIVLTFSDGPQRLVSNESGVVSFPQRLSEIGCFDPDNPRDVVSGVIPYQPNAQLWSDGAEKRRFLAIPDGTTIDRLGNCDDLPGSDCEQRGEWDLPIGSVLIKEFAIGDTAVETRLFMRHEDGGWGSYSYAWNDEQTDASLLTAAVTRTVNGEQWTYPGTASCNQCHTAASGVTLGLETRQLNGALRYVEGEAPANQLDTLDHIGMLSPALDTRASQLPAFATPGSGVSVEEEARAYLHTNCSMCHRERGGNSSNMVLRYDATLAEMNVCDEEPLTRSWPDLDDPRLLAPGQPGRSLIAHRMRSLLASERMPPLASSVVDEIGASVVDTWISSIASCE
ncbi:MAG: PQQ-dependent sugar dehydrogenase [Myxococcota bacterium]